MRRTTHIAAILSIFIATSLVSTMIVYLGLWSAEVAIAYVAGAVFGGFVFWRLSEAAP